MLDVPCFAFLFLLSSCEGGQFVLCNDEAIILCAGTGL